MTTTPEQEAILPFHGRAAAWLILAPVLLYFLLVFAWPLLRILWQSVVTDDGHLTFAYFARMGASRTYAHVFAFTLELAAGVTATTLLLGFPMAHALVRVPARWRPLLLVLVLLPFWTSVIVRTFTWLVLLGHQGVVNDTLVALGLVAAPLQLLHTNFAVYVGLVYYVLPFTIVSLYSFLRALDPAYMRAAEVLGARPFQAFLRVYLPLSRPGLVSSGIIGFVLTIGFYITPQVLGGVQSTTVPMLIETQVTTVDNWHFASALSVTLLLAVGVLHALARAFGDRGGVVAGGVQ